MTDRNCGNCRYYVAEEADSGDCLSMVSGRVKTKVDDRCGAHAKGRFVDLALDRPVSEEV